jgi:hypothetical protein
MTNHRKFAQAVRLGVGAALLASAALMSGSASAQTALCSASGLGGRQLAYVSVSPRDPSVCVRVKLGTPAPPGTPDCWSAARNFGFTCINIVDLN